MYRPPPPEAAGFQVLSYFAIAENSPAQNACRSDRLASSYFGQKVSTSMGMVEASTAPSERSASSVAAVHSVASGRWSHRITGRNDARSDSAGLTQAVVSASAPSAIRRTQRVLIVPLRQHRSPLSGA